MLHAPPALGADLTTSHRLFQPSSSSSKLGDTTLAAPPLSLTSLLASTGPSGLPDLYQSSLFSASSSCNSNTAKMEPNYSGYGQQQGGSAAGRQRYPATSDGFARPFPLQASSLQQQAQAPPGSAGPYAPSTFNYQARSQGSSGGIAGSSASYSSSMSDAAPLYQPGGMSLDAKSPGMMNSLFSPGECQQVRWKSMM